MLEQRNEKRFIQSIQRIFSIDHNVLDRNKVYRVVQSLLIHLRFTTSQNEREHSSPTSQMKHIEIADKLNSLLNDNWLMVYRIHELMFAVFYIFYFFSVCVPYNFPLVSIFIFPCHWYQHESCSILFLLGLMACTLE